jgi:arylsulfatase A-like enzyme
MRQPNILYLHSHDTGRYVQPYGYAVDTPHIQKLAEQGVLFRQAFCANPTCSPSRAALLTGQWPHTNGMIGLAHRGFALRDDGLHIAHTLRRAGYTTAVAGQQHVGRYQGGVEQVRDLGYDHVLGTNPGDAGEVTRAAVEFLNQRHTQPFFLSVGYFDTHRSFPVAEVEPGYVRPPAPLPDTPEVRQDMAAFLTSARRLDDSMGQVLAALDQTGLAADTLVICTTDHGIAFPFMKCNLTDHGLGVMLIMRGPGGFAGGKVIDAMVSQVDIFPTLCECLGLPRPERLQGVSILPLVRGEATTIREEVFAEVNYHAAYEPMRCVRTTRWKYIRRFDPRPGPVLANCDDCPSKDVLLASGWKNRAPAEEALYDLVFDPNESNNLAGQAAHADVLRDMRGRLEKWMRQTDDPLLRGPLALPAGARVNGRDQVSPNEPITQDV